jgi:hypothetical protein
MARTYREIGIDEMVRTVEEAMSQAINWWGDLPPPMKEAIEQFRTQLGAAIDSLKRNEFEQMQLFYNNIAARG